MVRAFVALELPDEVKTFLYTIIKDLRTAIKEARWVNTQAMHLTLKFLGDVPLPTIPTVVTALEKPLTIRGPIQLRLSGLGCFPNIKRPRVLWIGVTDTQSILRPLVEEIENALLPLGFPRESRSFKPHLTLARVRSSDSDASGMKSLVEHQDLAGKLFTVENAVLYESILKPEGAQYRPIKKFCFLAP